MKVLLQKFILFIFFISFVGGCCSNHNPPPYEKYSESRVLLGTFIKLDICYEKNQENQLKEVIDKVWERFADIHSRMSVFNEKSEVVRINQSYQKPVIVSKDIYQLLKKAIFFYKITKGAFDITVFPLIELWQNAAIKNIMPNQNQIIDVKKVVGCFNIKLLQNNFVQILSSDTKIDLGGIAKGFAVDEAVKILRGDGFYNFFIDAGGDLFVSGKNCNANLWRIGIRDPRNISRIIDKIEVTDMAITTSGDYEQFYEIQDQKWSHIINPVTGYPQRNITSATVLAPTATEADALSTALCILTPQEGASLIDSLGPERASLVITLEGGKIIKHESTSYKRF